MRLAEAQAAMMAQIVLPEVDAPQGWSERRKAGLAIYRNAYRSRLVDTLAEIYPLTRQWVGEEVFGRAAAHHLILYPPSRWTIDLAGVGFDETLADLFTDDPEVSELAWLEAAMHSAFVAADREPVNPQRFALATAGFASGDWEELKLEFIPGLVLRPVTHDCAGIWQALSEGKRAPESVLLSEPRGLVVWREDLKPVFQAVPQTECTCLAAMLGGASYAECCDKLADMIGEVAAVSEAGSMLARWLKRGWIAGVKA